MSANKEESPKELALKSVPTAWRERLISEASHVGCKADDDVLWTVIASVINAWASAGAAGSAAQTVNASIQKIPEMIYQGATAAGYDINLEFKKRFEGYGQTVISSVGEATKEYGAGILRAINDSSQKASSRIQIAGQNVEAASKTLENMLNGVIEQKAKEGLQQWADAARVAGQEAAEAASQSIYSKASMVILGALLLSMVAGGGIMYFVTADRMAPLLIDHGSQGRSVCFEANGHGYCELSGTKQQLSKLHYDPPSNL